MTQYCRYCNYAFDYNGEAKDFLCTAVAPWGNDGAGHFYPASVGKRANCCKYYEHNGFDIFRTDKDGNPVPYKPRGPVDCDYDMIPADWVE